MNARIFGAQILAVVMAVGSAGVTKAAGVSWGPATLIAADSDVVNSGLSYGALNFVNAGTGSVTVNGVTFTNVVPTGSNFTSGVFTVQAAVGGFNGTANGSGAPPFSGLSAAYRSLLGTQLTANGALTVTTIGFGGLKVGDSYRVQIWSSNPTPGTDTVTVDGVRTLRDNTTGVDGGLGEYTIGTFVADNTFQNVFLIGNAGSSVAAVSVRAYPAPEPLSMAAAAAAAVVGAMGLRRRRPATSA
jgi:hypothetical protein